MGQTLGEILDAAARGHFPPPDGATTVVAQAGERDAGVVAFTAHSVVFVDEDPAWVRELIARMPCDALAATMNPLFLAALLERTGRGMDTIDLLTVATALPGPPPVPLREITGAEHPRVRSTLRRRDAVRVWAADGGVVILGRGVAGRWETAIEVDEDVRENGLGRLLAVAARHLVPAGTPVWSQQSPGNARSVRVFQAAGFRPVGSEALMLPIR
ncbi:GNAT family N-acetyltransferase [Actinoplanes sp. NPDC051861]|uniref:GNAT family N-acetyltransferase n=1 Tax=Actinoplanes sp. NPDC051861 TaxID=3155170 RepID=UPI00343966F0